MFVGDRTITMPRGWIAQFKDGKVFCEDDLHWGQLPDKRNIARLILKWEDRFWEITDKVNYTAPMITGYYDSATGGMSVDSRAIGYYDVENKMKVYLRVDERTGTMKWEYEPF